MALNLSKKHLVEPVDSREHVSAMCRVLCHPQARTQPPPQEAATAARWAFVFLRTPPHHAEAENNGVPCAGSIAAEI